MQPQQACLCTQMANSTPASKRMKFTSPTHTVSDQKALDIIHTAQGIPFPWKEAVPEEISDWFHTLAKSHNTAPEFLFCGCLTTVATLMGPLSSVKVRETYSEPTNLYLVCVAEPGVGKTQAIRLSVLDPLSAIGPPLSHIHVDDYTRQGLFAHLKQQEHRALMAYDEISSFFDLIQRRQLDLNAERQLYCRLYDAGIWSKVTGKFTPLNQVNTKGD